MNCVLPNSDPARPPKVNLLPITTLPLNSISSRVISVPIPTLLDEPLTYRDVAAGDETSSGLFTILKSPSIPVIPADHPPLPFL